MAAIIDDLVRDHARFQRFLDRYEAEIAKLAAGASPNYELLRLLSEYFSLFPDEMHHKKEDLVYDALADRVTASDETLQNLRAEHDKLSKLANNFARHVASVLNDQEIPLETLIESASAYIRAMIQHMQKEEEVFFPQAVIFLKEEDWTRIHASAAGLFVEEIKAEKAKQILKIETALDEYFC